jgi:hypothetical protein
LYHTIPKLEGTVPDILRWQAEERAKLSGYPKLRDHPHPGYRNALLGKNLASGAGKTLALIGPMFIDGVKVIDERGKIIKTLAYGSWLDKLAAAEYLAYIAKALGTFPLDAVSYSLLASEGYALGSKALTELGPIVLSGTKVKSTGIQLLYACGGVSGEGRWVNIGMLGRGVHSRWPASLARIY